MNKKINLTILAVLTFVSISFAQAEKKEWPEMKTFHSFMSATFHPSEEGNLKPLKEKADSLLLSVRLWRASTIPADYKPEETKKALNDLLYKCQAIQKAVVTKQSDDSLKKLIAEAHEIFHTIVEKCKTEGE